MPMHRLQAAWLDATVSSLESFLNNETNNPDDRTIETTDRKYLWRARSRMIKLAAQIREDEKAVL